MIKENAERRGLRAASLHTGRRGKEKEKQRTKTVQGQRRQASAQEGAELVWKHWDRRKQRRR